MASVLVERSVQQRRWSLAVKRLLPLSAAGLMVFILWAGWQLTGMSVDVTVDGMRETVQTHRSTVGDLLLDLGVTLQDADRVAPAVDTPLTRDTRITIERARPVRILADSRDLRLSTWGTTPREVLRDGGMPVDTYDQILVNGFPIGLDDPLPALQVGHEPTTFDRGFAWDAVEAEPVQLRVYRSVPIVVHEGGMPYTVNATAETVGEALRQAEVILYLGDRVQPSLGSRVTANMHVYIQRSVPVSLRVDGRQIKTRTQADTVGDALTDLGITVAGRDRVEPPLATELYDNAKITITRVQEDVEVEEEIAPYETVYVADPALPIDTQEVLAAGANGITRTRYRVRYEDGELTTRVLEDTWVAQEPAERRIAYGQAIEPKVATVDGSTFTYWRKMKMLATSYHPAALGGSTRTFTGDTLAKGVVAVDPRIVPLRSQVFVPGYGNGAALDTGGGIRARRIDLGYDDSNFVSVSKWVDVYLLWPPPPDYQITWVLPNFPPVPE